MRVVRVPDLRQQVYVQLKENILSGGYPADTLLYENSVARDFGVSRTPAREALVLLVQDGLLEQEGRGFRFPQFGGSEIADVFEVRLRLEPFAVRRAVETASSNDLDALVKLIRSELAAHEKRDSYQAANHRIRDAIFALVNNPRLVNAIRVHENYTRFVRQRTLSDPHIRAVSVEGMKRLAEAIESRDAEAAEVAMAQLLLLARRAILAQLEDK